ncbi:hypothetical protein JTB14_017745 [Gonioctena quinquepunctata]|nr:hypothetical protein JTB14_017745 [Gonioctena quinquepunctata]
MAEIVSERPVASLTSHIVSGNTGATPKFRIVDESTSVPSTSSIISKSTTARSTPLIVSEAINILPTSGIISQGRRATLACNRDSNESSATDNPGGKNSMNGSTLPFQISSTANEMTRALMSILNVQDENATTLGESSQKKNMLTKGKKIGKEREIRQKREIRKAPKKTIEECSSSDSNVSVTLESKDDIFENVLVTAGN